MMYDLLDEIKQEHGFWTSIQSKHAISEATLSQVGSYEAQIKEMVHADCSKQPFKKCLNFNV